jgi:hypothetical protein
LESTDDPIGARTTTDTPKPRAFSASELAPCAACSRANPPTRTSCLYCGAPLEITHVDAFSAVAPQETEAGSSVSFHVVGIAGPQVEGAALEQVAGLLDKKLSEVKLLLDHSIGAPLFRAESEEQAQVVAEKLREQGLRTCIIPDEQFAVERAPVAVSALEITNDSVVGRVGRSKQTVAAAWADITLVVTGRLYFETREIDQKQNRAKQVIAEREMLIDEAVLDIYVRGDDDGWRIRSANFDFSCLGASKELTAFTNFTVLTRLLREHATGAVFDDSYAGLRAALNSLWPAEARASAKERRGGAFARFESSATSIDNELQFTRYSRLLRYLHASKSEGHVPQA